MDSIKNLDPYYKTKVCQSFFLINAKNIFIISFNFQSFQVTVFFFNKIPMVYAWNAKRVFMLLISKSGLQVQIVRSLSLLMVRITLWYTGQTVLQFHLFCFTIPEVLCLMSVCLPCLFLRPCISIAWPSPRLAWVDSATDGGATTSPVSRECCLAQCTRN